MTSSQPSEDDSALWLSRDEQAAWMPLAALLMTMPSVVDGQLKRDSGLNLFEYTILSGLSECEGQCARLATLANVVGGSSSRLSHAVARLERQGWVERRTQANGEPRATDVFLTDEGQAKLTAAAPDHVREVRRLVFEGLSTPQITQLSRLARRILSVTAPETAALLADRDRQMEREGPGAW
ncbi:MarR family winged helix-turn-helix transcriptional regulator [Paractinoplanes lichenicola]|uniref:MarR family transcriptional regulator n=1 Tax=Paractinoplanes lichenicola TaxID=2802976 RepID=A0ABS1VP46_9ACTN|nr:MarR family transcriptional regulator [Actinoplanes lichenicola]MBL7255990.1 MarR family transcriptional regulator [Actinoplanes lichenicola]